MGTLFEFVDVARTPGCLYPAVVARNVFDDAIDKMSSPTPSPIGSYGAPGTMVGQRRGFDLCYYEDLVSAYFVLPGANRVVVLGRFSSETDCKNVLIDAIDQRTYKQSDGIYDWGATARIIVRAAKYDLPHFSSDRLASEPLMARGVILNVPT